MNLAKNMRKYFRRRFRDIVKFDLDVFMKAIKIRRLYDGSKNKPIDDAIVVFDNTGIKEVLKYDEENKLKEYTSELVDMSEKYMMPGLIDAHTHLLLPGDGSTCEHILANNTLGEIQLIAAKNAYRALKHGVTTVRDCGSLPDLTFSLRNAIEKGIINGPDLVLCGSPLTTTGGHLHCFQGEVDGVEEVRKLVRKQFKKGANYTKLIVDWGGSIGIVKGALNFTLEELNAAVSETHRLLSKATAHCLSIEGIRLALDANVDGIEHCNPINSDGNVIYDPKLNEMIAKRGVILCNTIQAGNGTIKYLLDKDELTEQENIELAEHQKCENNEMEIMRLQIKDGVSCVAGSDAGWRYTKFGELYIGLVMMSQVGMKNLEIINSSTGASATYLDLDHKLGFIKPGLQADLLILDDDPGENIINTGKVHMVFKKGSVVSDFANV